MTHATESGFLVLADISGYTAYVSGVELEHADQILTELLEGVIERFKVALTISKLEGDAVFANVSDARLPRPEALLELIENTYLAFRQVRDSSQRRTTCGCRACSSMASLDLKFCVHHGEYVVQAISGHRELAGSDVNLLHRLSKNHVSAATGWKAYALLTQAALERMNLKLEGLHAQVEEYEHLGPVQTFSMDMHARYEALIENRRVILPPEDADLTLTHEFASPPALVWQLVTDPNMLTRLMDGTTWTAAARPGGRSGPGARNHCSHGRGLTAFTYLDWRPFHYYTAEGREGKRTHREMYLVEPVEDGRRTRLTIRIKALMPLPRWFKRMVLRAMMSKDFVEYFRRAETLLRDGSSTTVQAE